MVRKRISRIFVFFMVLVMLVNVSFSFEDGKGFVQIGENARGENETLITQIADTSWDCLNSSTYIVPWSNTYVFAKYNIALINMSISKKSDNNYYLSMTANIICKLCSRMYENKYGSWSFEGIYIDSQAYLGLYLNEKQILSYTYYSKDGYAEDVPITSVRRCTYSETLSINLGSTYPRELPFTTQVHARAIDENGFAQVDSKLTSGNNKTIDLNKSPIIQTIFPLQATVLSELKTCSPSMTVSDPNGDTLTCKYYIDSVEKDSQSKSNTVTAQDVAFKAIDISILTEEKHTLKFEVSDGIADPVTQTVDIIVDKSPPVIGSVSAESDDSSITVSGSATDTVTDASALQYRYTIGSTVSDWVTATSWKAALLAPNTLYNAKFEAKDGTGHIASSDKSVYTKAQIPEITVNNTKESSADININDSNPAATQYQLMAGSSYINASGALTPSPQWITLTGKKITVTGLSSNTQYTIKAKVRNDEGAETAFSTQTAATTLALPPLGITKEQGINSIKISWNTVNNATGYDIEADGKTVDIGTATTYTHSGLQAETTHSYRLRTRNPAGAGPWSEYINVTTLPNPPDAPAIIPAETTYSAIILSWDTVAKSTGYEIEADGKTIEAGSATTYTDSGLQPNTYHKYRVRAKNAGGEGEWSAYTEVWTLPLPPEVPLNFEGVPTKNNITLTWSAADRAEGYELEIDGSTTPTAITVYTHAGLSANSTHTYKIRAFNRGGRSAWSSTQTITTWPEIPVAPTNIMATSEKDSITLTWYSSPFAESYDVQVDGNNTVNIKELSYTQKNLTAGTKHSYRLRAKNITGDGEWSNPIEISTLPEETAATTSGAIGLTNIAAVVTNKTITIAWQAAKPNVQYQVEADGRILDNGKDTVYNHTGLKPQSFHTYRVRTVDADGNGQWCAILALSTLPDLSGAPANLNATASDTQIELSWTKEDGIAYEVEADGEVLSAGEVAGYVNNGLEPGTTHTYRVRGRNITGVTAWSDSITKSTTSPSYEVDCKNGEEFNFSLLAANIDDFGGMTFVVAYNPEQLEVQDLCGLTADNEKASGKIPGTNLTVKYGEGRIEFTVDESVAPGTNWSGEISAIVFKSKIDGKAGINYSIE